MYAPEVQAKIDNWRQLARENKLTIEQTREALALLRGNRAQASATSNASKTRKAAAKVAPNVDAMMDELDGL